MITRHAIDGLPDIDFADDNGCNRRLAARIATAR